MHKSWIYLFRISAITAGITLLTACGGAGEDMAIPLGHSKLGSCLIAAGKSAKTESDIKQFMNCIHGTYSGVEVGTGRTCTLYYRGLNDTNEYAIAGRNGIERHIMPAGSNQAAKTSGYFNNYVFVNFLVNILGQKDRTHLSAQAAFWNSEKNEATEVFFNFAGKDYSGQLTPYGHRVIRIKKSSGGASGSLAQKIDSYCKITSW